MKKPRAKKVKSVELTKALEEFGFIMKSKGKVMSNDDLLNRLNKMTENGILFPVRDSQVWITLKTRAAYRKVDVEDYIRSALGFDFDHVERSHGLKGDPADVREKHIEVLKSLIDENGKVTGIAKNHPSTYKYIFQMAKKNNCSISQVINALLNVPSGTYEYLSSKSAYVISNSNFVGNDEEFKNAMAKIIRLRMDKDDYVKFPKDARNVVEVLKTIANMNAISEQEALNLFVPEAKLSKHQWAGLDIENIKDLISSYNDGTGCVDAIFNNESLVYFLRRLAKQHGRTVTEEILSYGDFYLTKGYYEVDYVDYCKTLLTSYYGEGGDASDLYTRDKRLYYILVALKNNFQGGALGSMQDVFGALGFDYEGYNKNRFSKYHDENYVKALIFETFKTTKITDSLSYYPKVVRAITMYAGKLGLNFVDTLKTLGFEYAYNGGTNLKKHLFLSSSEYEKYRQLKLAVAKKDGGNFEFEAQNEDGKEKN